MTHADSDGYANETYHTPSMQLTPARNHLNPHGTDAPYETDRVLLWPDTFNNYLNHLAPGGRRGARGRRYRSKIPPRALCCGRPLYDAGMLDHGRELWKQILKALRPWIRAGIPVVGLEPSCVAAFRDELVNLFPNDDDARGCRNRRSSSRSSWNAAHQPP